MVLIQPLKDQKEEINLPWISGRISLDKQTKGWQVEAEGFWK